ncbi:hydrolase [Gramella sp. AN32]|uniref:BT0820 family HAD-type phosphatase n=1 Tax=Christiangramia antarctica TaxID=2058158 RepID=A0ABW5X5L5_9FLAO|nr:hydrolase [Gramella sp. AN32]MCM4154791.1 hydrolase [Gramella sp. AN32]
MPKSLTIAVDFDGTIVENKFPEIGKPMLFAFESLRKLQEEGHRLILWTYRHGVKLDDAVEFCGKNGLKFHAINKSYPEEEFDDTISRKILADIFIDDRNLGGMKGWGEIYHSLSLQKPDQKLKKKKKSGLFGRF